MKNRFLILAAFLPLFSFADDFEPKKLLIRKWVSFGVESGSVNSQGAPVYNVSSEDDIFSILNTSTFGVCVNSARRDYNFGVVVPSFTTNVVLNSSYNVLSITNSVRGVLGGSTCVASVARFPRVASLFQSTAALYWNGYRGCGFEDIFLKGDKACVNVNYPLLYADVLSSTNTVFRQILLSHLSLISGSLVNIGSSVGTINNDYREVNTISLDPSFSNLTSRVSFSNGLDGYGLFLDQYMSSNPDRSSEIAKAVSENARRNLGFILNACIDPDSPFYGDSLDSIVSDPDRFVAAVAAGGGGSALPNMARDIKRLSTNDWASVVTNQLAKNSKDAKQQLQDNRDSITNRLAHMFDDDPGSVGRAIRSAAGSANYAANYAGDISEQLRRGITVAVVNQSDTSVGVHLDGPINIEQSQFNSLSTPIAGLERKISTWYDEWYSFFNLNSPAYNWDKFFDMVSEFKSQNHQDLSALSNAFSVVSISNLLHDIDTKLADNFPNLTNGNLNVSFSASFGSLLHEDYSNFVEHSFSDILTNLEDQYPGVYDSLHNLGLSDDSYNGRWWNLSAAALSQISVSVYSNMLMLSSLMSDIAAVDDLADESLGKSPLSACRDIVREMPSKTQIEDYISQCTNAANSVSVAGVDLVSSFDAVSNSYVSIFRPFKGSFDSPGSSVTFFKAANGDYVTIPVGDQSNAWLILRLGISFALVAVNILLLPKYILMLFTLFIKAYRIGIKFFPDDR